MDVRDQRFLEKVAGWLRMERIYDMAIAQRWAQAPQKQWTEFEGSIKQLRMTPDQKDRVYDTTWSFLRRRGGRRRRR